jgi:hypothetical protein
MEEDGCRSSTSINARIWDDRSPKDRAPAFQRAIGHQTVRPGNLVADYFPAARSTPRGKAARGPRLGPFHRETK